MQSSNPDTSPETPTQRLATILLGQDVRQWIEERRAANVAWRFIARELHATTDGQIDVTHETLRQWYGSEKAGAA